MMGRFHECGVECEENIETAIDWYTKAANQGSDQAQFNLGWLYEQGQGCEKNLIMAA